MAWAAERPAERASLRSSAAAPLASTRRLSTTGESSSERNPCMLLPLINERRTEAGSPGRHFLGRAGVAQLGTDAAVTGRRRRGRRVGRAVVVGVVSVGFSLATALGRLGLG